MPEVKVIVIASFRFCDDRTCAFAIAPHLLIQFHHIQLDGNQGVALSYTWGEFNRQEVPIGHDVTGNVKNLVLGQEWHIGDLQFSLANLSYQYGGCWIDQLCIKQAALDIRKALAEIPSIYRTLDVVALLPSSVCSCSENNASLIIQSFDSKFEKEAGKMAREVAGHQRKSCLNSSGLNSYFNRIWTRQELVYSRRISLVRTSTELLPCVKSMQDVKSLGTYAQLLFQRHVKAGQSTRTAYAAVESANAFYFRYAMDAMVTYSAYEHANIRTDAAFMLSKLLLGETIENQQPTTERLTLDSHVRSFLTQLSQLGRSARTATTESDYVLSVWVDCPGYVIPTNFQSMDLPHLLEDAILQLENHLGISPLATAPAGLFGRDEAGGLWRPTTYLQHSSIQDARDIYNVLSKSQRVPVSNASIPLICFLENTMPISSRADDYIRLFESWSTAKVFDAMKTVCNEWSHDVLARVRDALDMSSTSSHEDYFVDLFAGLVAKKAMNATQSIAPQEVTWNFRDTDHHHAMYGLIAMALGINRAACEFQGLRLMVSLEYPPCIGFMKPELSLQMPTPTYNERVHYRQNHTYRTVCTATYSHYVGCMLLEAAIEEQGPPVVLKVSGIWVPMKHTPLDEVWAIAKVSNMNGCLGGRLSPPSTDFDPIKYFIYNALEFGTDNAAFEKPQQNASNIKQETLDNPNLSVKCKVTPKSHRPGYCRLIVRLTVVVSILLTLAFAIWTAQSGWFLTASTSRVHQHARETCSVGKNYWKVEYKAKSTALTSQE